MSKDSRPGNVTVCWRLADGQRSCSAPWLSADVELLGQAAPWRTFRWYKGQRHYSGAFWSSTMSDHVVYESRLELSRLLFADFDPAVRRIVAQPFLLQSTMDAVQRRHVPDYLLLTDNGLVVVDVKPQHRVARPEVACTFAWTRSAVLARGWRFEVWSEPPPVELDNVRFLAGYRRDWLFDAGLLETLKAADLDGVSLGVACRSVPGWPQPVVRSGLLHLLWSGHFCADLSRPLSMSHVLRRSAV